jgi:hypothetical protein
LKEGGDRGAKPFFRSVDGVGEETSAENLHTYTDPAKAAESNGFWV